MITRDVALKKLYSKAADLLGRQYDRQFIIDFQIELRETQFNGFLDDWREYITTDVREIWQFLDDMAQVSLWFIANSVDED